MTDEVEVAGLTRQDLRAFKEADHVCFHQMDGKGIVRLIKPVKDHGPYEDREREYPLQVESRVRYHKDMATGTPYTREQLQRARCFYLVYGGQYGEEWLTIVGCLKVGDVLILEWVGSDNNGYVERAKVVEESATVGNAGLGMGLHHDRLNLRVRRTGRRDLVFQVGDSICPNNTARMVQV